MDVKAYLKRINYSGSLTPTEETLAALQMAHLLAVPFENLDISLGRPIVLKDNALFDKIVTRRRGGFCYELNGVFATLLRELGYKVDMLSAAVYNAQGGLGPEFDHMALLVTLDKRWLVDVGFGDSFRLPLRVDDRDVQTQPERAYRIDQDGQHLTVMQQSPGGTWEAQYRFTLDPHEFSDYEAMCRYQQTSPESSFTKRRICTLATPTGRVTLSDMRLITTEEGQRQERLLVDEGEYSAMLREQFGVELHSTSDV
jgi:N-hydroxyarylamine O-acetyltransferase